MLVSFRGLRLSTFRHDACLIQFVTVERDNLDVYSGCIGLPNICLLLFALAETFAVHPIAIRCYGMPPAARNLIRSISTTINSMPRFVYADHSDIADIVRNGEAGKDCAGA